MTTRTLVLALLIGSLSVSISAQGNSCYQYQIGLWSGCAGNNPGEPDPGYEAFAAYQQSIYGGAGPNCRVPHSFAFFTNKWDWRVSGGVAR